MARKIYLASSWRNEYQPEIIELLRSEGHEVYDFRNPAEGWASPVPGVTKGFAWSDLDPDWQAWDMRRYRALLEEHPVAMQGFMSDWRAMQWADTGVLLLPSGRSAHLEGGYFADRPGKRLHVLILEPQEPELMYLMANEIHLTRDELLRGLSRPPDGPAPS